MASPALFLSSTRAHSTVCHQCLRLAAATAIRPGAHQRRGITRAVLEKRRLAQEAWDAKAEQIQNGETPHLWEIFKERGFVKDTAGTDEQISELMRRKRIGAYVGVDPTAPSLHVGHLLPFMALFWMYMHGYGAVTLVGGATCRIGDPTGRLTTRDPMAKTDATMNIVKIHYQLKRMWVNVEHQARRFGYEKEWAWDRQLLNNSQWYSSLRFVEVVQRLFKGLRLGPLLSRETVKRKMNEGDGMSLDEFVYPLMQAWDWWHMFSSPKGVQMQIGGSDQYGNIISGMESIKYLRDTEPDPSKKMPDDLMHNPVGFTVPLLTDASGAKFGKSAGNAVWLDPFMTNTFDLYGYFVRRADADVEHMLKLLTFHRLEDIKALMEEHNRDPTKRVAQHTLAYEVVTLVHGEDEAKDARARHRALYSKSGDGANEGEDSAAESTHRSGFIQKFYPEDAPGTSARALGFRVDIQLPESLILGKSISKILYGAGLVNSLSEANRLAKEQHLLIGGAPGNREGAKKVMDYSNLTFTPVKLWFPQETQNFLIDGKLLILRRGKHFIRVIEMISDDEWEKKGEFYPGEKGSGKVNALRRALKDAAGGSQLPFKRSEIEKILEETEELSEDFKGSVSSAKTTQLVFPKRQQTWRPKPSLDGRHESRTFRQSLRARNMAKKTYQDEEKRLATERYIAAKREQLHAAAHGQAGGTNSGTSNF